MLSDKEIQDLFRQEGLERIESLESTLLGYDASSDPTETNASLFRDLHTLKGSGNMAGFVVLGDYVHELESSLGPWHGSGKRFDKGTISRFLEVCDALRDLVQSDPRNTAKPTITFQSSGAAAPARPSPQPTAAPSPAAAMASGELHQWLIHVEPAPSLFHEGISMRALLESLNELGETQIRMDLDNLPPLPELAAEECALAWNISIMSNATESSLRSVFDFLPLGSSVFLQIMDSAASDSPAPPLHPAAKSSSATTTATPAKPAAAATSKAKTIPPATPATPSNPSAGTIVRGLLCQVGDIPVMVSEASLKACRPPEREIQKPLGIALIDERQLTVIDLPTIFACPGGSERVLVIVEVGGQNFCLATHTFADFIEGPLHRPSLAFMDRQGVNGFVLHDNSIVLSLDMAWFSRLVK